MQKRAQYGIFTTNEGRKWYCAVNSESFKPKWRRKAVHAIYFKCFSEHLEMLSPPPFAHHHFILYVCMRKRKKLQFNLQVGHRCSKNKSQMIQYLAKIVLFSSSNKWMWWHFDDNVWWHVTNQFHCDKTKNWSYKAEV